MKNQHTPGPWKTYTSGKVVEVQASDGKPVISRSGFDESNTPLKVHEANARLIAAAPELLAMCRRLYAWVGRDPDGLGAKREHYDATIEQYHALLEKVNGAAQ